MDVHQLNLALLGCSLVLLVAVTAVRLAQSTNLPLLLGYLALGVVLGQSGVQIDNLELAQSLGFAALIVILAEGGLKTRWVEIRSAVPAAALLATAGVLVSITVTALVAHLVFASSWKVAFLIGAIVSSTDAAAVFSILRDLPLPRRLTGILEAESGFNDAPVIIIVILLSSPTAPVGGWPGALLLIGYELLVGAAVGIAVGWLGAAFLHRIKLTGSGLYPVTVAGLCALAYGAAATAHASGFLAVYLAALVLGNKSLPYRQASVGFAEGLAWLAQIGLFVMLGLLVDPTGLADAVVPALVIGAGVTLLARPLSVLASLAPFDYGWRERAFVSWAGLRGAVPIVLAIIPMTEGVASSDRLFDIVVVLVIVFTLLQALTMRPVAKRLGVVIDPSPRELSIEAAPLEELKADMLQLRVAPGSRLAGVELFELQLPRGAVVSLVVRDNEAFVPERTTRLRDGDQILVVTTRQARGRAERRLRAISRGGRMAGWHGEAGRE